LISAAHFRMRTRAIGLEIVEERRSRDPERLGDDFSRDALGQHEASEDNLRLAHGARPTHKLFRIQGPDRDG
jgi:hypothetical protein